MNNGRKPVLLKKRFDRSAVRQVELRNGKVGMTSQYLEPALFEPRIVVAVDDIKANDPSSLRQQALGTRPLLDPAVEYVALVLTTAIAYPIGLWAYRRADRRIGRLGTINQY